MGTRSLTTFNDEWKNEEIAVIYRQYDGYPQGHGRELFEFLNEMVIVNGISLNGPPKIANGMDCLAAQVISHFKGSEVGGIYLHKSGTRDIGEQYIYTIYINEETLMIKMTNTYDDDESFDGNIKDFGEWLNEGKIVVDESTMEQSISDFIKDHMGETKTANGQKN
jgi:hypothetical protein